MPSVVAASNVELGAGIDFKRFTGEFLVSKILMVAPMKGSHMCTVLSQVTAKRRDSKNVIASTDFLCPMYVHCGCEIDVPSP